MSDSHALELLQLTTKRKEAIKELHEENRKYEEAVQPIQTRIRLVEEDLTELIDKL
ncbi:hypothetical protein KAU11_10780 [Candidatus Babeliales bacterium]|nr:hypothetical protein [Candidatus Babeliales bacterium]